MSQAERNADAPSPRVSDPEAIRRHLENWAGPALGLDPVRLSPIDAPDGTGMSNLTLLFDIDGERGGQRQHHAVVGRLQGAGQALAFPDYDLPMQYAVLRYLAQIPQVPSPIPLAEEPTGELLGAPFYLMERTPGRIPTDIPPYHSGGWLQQESPAQRRALWLNGVAAMAELHRLDPASADMRAFVDAHRFPKSLDEQLAYWERYLAWAFDSPYPLCAQTLRWLRDNQPAEQKRTLCWGDARMANVIFDNQGSGVAALLDWEMLALGDPLQDLAWWIYMDDLFSAGTGTPRLEGLPESAETAAFWADRSGLDTSQLDYYQVYAAWRFTLIFSRIALNMGNRAQVQDNFASWHLQQLAATLAIDLDG